MTTKRIPLIGQVTNRNSNPDSFQAFDQYFENCYPEVTKNPITGAVRAFLYKRLGTAHVATAGAGFTGVAGVAVWTGRSSGPIGVMPFLDAANNLKIYTSTPAVVGASISNVFGAALISETAISGVANLTIATTKTSDSLGHGWFYPDGGAWTEITSGNFPPNQSTPLNIAGEFAHLDGYAFIMDRLGNIWNSDLNSLANWTITSVIPANAFPDGGCGVARLGSLIVAFGFSSIEFYRNAGNPSGSPLSRVGEGVKKIGCQRIAGVTAQRTYLNVGNELYFVGYESDPGRYAIFKLTGMGDPSKVSNAAVDKLIASAKSNGSEIAICGTFTMHGMNHLLINTGTLPQPCFCIDTGIWWYLRPAKSGATDMTWDAALGIKGRAAFTSANVASKGFFQAAPNSPVFQDDSTAYARTIQTELIDIGTNKRKFISSIDFIGDTESVSGNDAISISYDDYANFVGLGNVDFSLDRKRVTRCGSGRRFSVKISGSVNGPSRLEAMDIDFEVGTG